MWLAVPCVSTGWCPDPESNSFPRSGCTWHLQPRLSGSAQPSSTGLPSRGWAGAGAEWGQGGPGACPWGTWRVGAGPVRGWGWGSSSGPVSVQAAPVRAGHGAPRWPPSLWTHAIWPPGNAGPHVVAGHRAGVLKSSSLNTSPVGAGVVTCVKQMLCFPDILTLFTSKPSGGSLLRVCSAQCRWLAIARTQPCRGSGALPRGAAAPAPLLPGGAGPAAARPRARAQSPARGAERAGPARRLSWPRGLAEAGRDCRLRTTSDGGGRGPGAASRVPAARWRGFLGLRPAGGGLPRDSAPATPSAPGFLLAGGAAGSSRPGLSCRLLVLLPLPG